MKNGKPNGKKIAKGNGKPAPAENGKRPPGRPQLEISEDTVQKLAGIQCSLDEIAAVVGCSPSLLQKRFSAVIEKGRIEGKASLKRTQFVTAMGYSYKRKNADGTVTEIYTTPPNPTMLIWLGKIVLGQVDTSRREISGLNGQPIETRTMPTQDEVAEKIAGILSLAEARAAKERREAQEETG